MTGILFICHGNICRSPMAEFVMKDIVARRGLANELYIESAATSSEELGNPVHPGTKRKLCEHGIDCSGKTARRITKSDYNKFDLLICMDEENLRNAAYIMGGDPDKKIHLLLKYTGENRAIADPWYTGSFEETWDDVYSGCSSLMESLFES